MTNLSAPVAQAAPVEKGSRTLLLASLRLRRTQIGLLIVIVLAFFAIFGPYLAPHGASTFMGMPYTQPTSKAPLGVDYLGQDVWSRFLLGGRSLLVMALVSTVIGVGLGIALGLIAAYSPGAVDGVLMRLMDVILAFPQIMLALVMVATVGPHTWVIVLAIVLTTAPRVTRVARGAALPIVERDFVASAEVLGVSRVKILFVEIFPNTLGPLMVESSLRLTYSIGVIASLAFLGLAPNPNGPNWGSMIQQNQSALAIQPWGVIVPIIAIALLTIGTGLVGDGIARTTAGLERGRD